MTDTKKAAGLAIVTGGSRGIGKAICLKLAQEGYSIAVGYASSKAAANDTATEIMAAGGRAEAFQVDLSHPETIPALFEKAQNRFGKIQVLVANAGTLGDTRRLDEQSIEELQKLINTNVLGTMICAREAVRSMSLKNAGSGGVIVLVTSVAARTGGLNGLVPYAATKGALETFVRGLSNETASEGIRVVGLAPGIIRTDMTSDEAEDAAQLQTPMGRIGQPSEIADAAAWLTSSSATYVCGTTLTVSGGR